MKEKNYRTIFILVNTAPVYELLQERLAEENLTISKDTMTLIHMGVVSFVMDSNNKNSISSITEEFAYALLRKNECGGFNDIDLCKMRATFICDEMIELAIQALTNAVPDYDSLKYNGDRDFDFEIVNERVLKLSLKVYDKY